MSDKCELPPEAWECTRTAGHEGPCAAIPVEQGVGMKSVMPPVAEIREQENMSMRIWTFQPSQSTLVDTTIRLVVPSCPEGVEVAADLYVVDDPAVAGYLPSRVWYDNYAKRFRMSYYTNPSLPVAVRPFQDGKTYVLIIFPEPEDVIQYDHQLRVLIEQVPCPNSSAGIAYVFVFGDDVYDQIVISGVDEET